MDNKINDGLFQLFNYVEFEDNINSHGIGLGLAMCKRIADSLNG